MLQSDTMRTLAARWPGFWANEWAPENEFGHWDGLRLRRTRQRYSIAVPKRALDLGEVQGVQAGSSQASAGAASDQ